MINFLLEDSINRKLKNSIAQSKKGYYTCMWVDERKKLLTSAILKLWPVIRIGPMVLWERRPFGRGARQLTLQIDTLMMDIPEMMI